MRARLVILQLRQIGKNLHGVNLNGFCVTDKLLRCSPPQKDSFLNPQIEGDSIVAELCALVLYLRMNWEKGL